MNTLDEKKYYALNWDTKDTKLGQNSRKHYRYYVNKNLENTLFVDKNTFDEFLIMRGNQQIKKGLFWGKRMPES